MKKTKLINKDGISKLLFRIANEIIEKNADLDTIAIIGIRTRGDFLAKRVSSLIKEISNKNIKFGTLDVTFYRDDFSSNWGSPKVGPSDVTFDVNKLNIILIDDVLYSGRTIRAAIEEIFSFGRPNSIQLGVLVDRGHRELPIKANYIGKNIPTADNEHVHVYIDEVDGKEEVSLESY
jgi:pyrimidine operon attenuation protein/uracil phosphoribosyltransferase